MDYFKSLLIDLLLTFEYLGRKEENSPKKPAFLFPVFLFLEQCMPGCPFFFFLKEKELNMLVKQGIMPL